jgi:hypothetical protein
MSIHSVTDEDFHWLVRSGFVKNYKVCFLCGEPNAECFVYWHGSTASIAMHERCADILANHLVKDAANHRLKYGRNG